jgi:hypothetical protein
MTIAALSWTGKNSVELAKPSEFLPVQLQRAGFDESAKAEGKGH